MFFQSPAAETIGQRGKEEVDLWGGYVTSSKAFRGPRPWTKKIFKHIFLCFFFFFFKWCSCIQLFACSVDSLDTQKPESFLTPPLTHIISLPSIKLLVTQPQWPPGAVLPPSDGPPQLSSLSEQFHFLIINLSARLCSASLFNHIREDGGGAHKHLSRTHTHTHISLVSCSHSTVSSPEPLEWLNTSRNQSAVVITFRVS